MERLTDYFDIEQRGRYFNVTWPGHETRVVTTPNRARLLLEILFDQIKVNCAVLLLTDGTRKDMLHINLQLWWNSPEDCSYHIIKGLGDFRVAGARLDNQTQAENFVENLEKRIMWNRLKNTEL